MMTQASHFPGRSAIVELVDDPLSRSKAVIISRFANPGGVLHRALAFSAVLLPSHKGSRCDNCLREFGRNKLRGCTGCKLDFYCGEACQLHAWSSGHRRLCKLLPRFTASHDFTTSEEHVQVESLLLAHTISGHFLPAQKDSAVDLDEESRVLLSLLPHPNPPPTPALPKSLASVPHPNGEAGGTHLADDLASRSLNNHWVIYSSELSPVAHAVFPGASRSFNHSCIPNASPVYVYGATPNRGPEMQIRALREIRVGEEITVPYIDPAQPYAVRQDMLRKTYGFTCQCPRCIADAAIAQKIPPAPPDTSSLDELHPALLRFVFGSDTTDTTHLERLPEERWRDAFPEDLLILKTDAHLPYLSSKFREASHSQQHDAARRSGMALLALYLTIYPFNYPVIGHHLLELAKVEWNAYITQDSDLPTPPEAKITLSLMRSQLAAADRILSISNSIGDDMLPEASSSQRGRVFNEIDALRRLLAEEERLSSR